MNKKLKGTYKQCKISKGTITWTAWIPTAQAQEGKTVVIQDSGSVIIEKVYHQIMITHKQLTEYYDVVPYGEDIVI